MGKPGRSRKKQNTGNELKQRILLISALVFCVLIMGLLIRVLVRGGKLTRLDMEEAKAKLLEQMGPFMRSAAKYADII